MQNLLEECVRRNRAIIEQWAGEASEIELYPGGSAVFAWLKLPEGINDVDFVARMAAEDGVKVTPGTAYGTPGHIRLGYGMIEHPSTLRQALALIHERVRRNLRLCEVPDTREAS